jgi:hypothetical protein
MRRILILLSLCLLFPLQSYVAAAPATQPTAQPIFVSTTQPVAVPYKLTDTNHILIRLKINGKGPFNFIVDTGAPVMILRVPAAEKLGLKPNARGIATLKQLDIEGGLTLKRVQCLVDTPFQIEGMNAIGASGVDLDGLLGYGILCRFRMQIDLTKDRMIWTPVDFVPSPYASVKTSSRAPDDPQEDHLEAMGGLLKLLGPLIKPDDIAPKHRGMVGIELVERNGNVKVQCVLGGSPAEKAGIFAGDRVISVNQKTVNSIADAQQAIATTLTGQPASLVVQRERATLTIHLICAEGL